MPSHDGSAAGGANSTGNSEAVEVSALFGELVDVGSFDVWVTVNAKVTPAPVIGKDEENVWSFSLRDAGEKKKSEDDSLNEGFHI